MSGESQGTPNAGAPSYAELAKDIAEGSWFDAGIVPLKGMDVTVVGTAVEPNRYAKEGQSQYQAVVLLNWTGARRPKKANATGFIRALATLEISDAGDVMGHTYTIYRAGNNRAGNPMFNVGAVDGKEVPQA